MAKSTEEYADKFRHLIDVRNQALEHMRAAQRLAVERRTLIEELVGYGFSQADVARELGVTRQAVQKMMAV